MDRADRPRPTVAIPATLTADNGELLTASLDAVEEYSREKGVCRPKREGWGLHSARHDAKGGRASEAGRENIEVNAVAMEWSVGEKKKVKRRVRALPKTLPLSALTSWIRGARHQPSSCHNSVSKTSRL